MPVERDAIRSRLRAQRRAIPAAQRIAAAESLARQLLSLPFAPTRGTVAGYWAMDGEISLHAWQLQLPETVAYCLPVLVDDQLRFAAWRPGAALVTNRFGIPEPDVARSALLAADDLALAVAPLVGYDTHGHRLGMGGGWYDRTFAARIGRAPPPWLVGAAFASQQLEALPAESWDVKLDAVCNEHASLHFDGPAQ